MARRRARGRDISGILLLDKPAGMTSNAALQTVKRAFNASKAGHTGSLDPLATGLLPICLGEATKVSGYLLDADKAYLATCRLGVTTRTGDAEGEVVQTRPVPVLDEARVREVLEGFSGEISQIPPMHSALKVNGTPLYKLAHRGEEIERQPRQVTIHRLALRRLAGDELELEVHCSKGTYIRTLVEDIGEALGCGAHVTALRRTRSGPFDLDEAVALAEIQHLAEDGFVALDPLLLPVERALAGWPAVELTENSAYYLLQGQAVQVPGAPGEGWVRLHRDNGVFLGLGQILDDGRVAPKRLFRQQ